MPAIDTGRHTQLLSDFFSKHFQCTSCIFGVIFLLISINFVLKFIWSNKLTLALLLMRLKVRTVFSNTTNLVSPKIGEHRLLLGGREGMHLHPTPVATALCYTQLCALDHFQVTNIYLYK